MGYIILALSLGEKIGIVVSFYYFFIYIIMTLNIFSIFLAIRLTFRYNTFKNISDFIYLKNNNKWLCFYLIAALLSLAGIPPFMGFYGKLFVFILLIDTGNYFLCFFLILLSILSSIYYLRMIRFLFFDDKEFEPIAFMKPVSW
jgi:NADH-quinone oxidoreductase subunit N